MQEQRPWSNIWMRENGSHFSHWEIRLFTRPISTFIKRVLRDGYQARIIPGIPSFCAAAAALNIGLAENKEEIHILPASYGIEEGLQMSGTKILMKAGKQMASVKETLRKSKGQFRMVENCGMDGERIYTDPEEVPEKTSYYSLIIIKEGS